MTALPHVRAFLLLLVTVSLGCDGIAYDLDSVPLREPDATTSGDVDGSMPDMPTPDGGRDMRDPPDPDMADVGPDLTDAADMKMEPGCQLEFPLSDTAPCNPTQTGECPENGICTLAVVTVPPPEIACLPREQEGESGDEEACGRPSDCLETYACVDWSLNEPDPRGKVCTRYCEIETGFGCNEDEFCTKADAQPPVEGIGWCTPTCDPYDPEACPDGQTCSIDYNYPAGTCQPNFRCVTVTDFQMQGDECGPGTDAARCVRGLTCYEVEIAAFECVRPCQSDADCGQSGTCSEPSGDWDLRYCE